MTSDTNPHDAANKAEIARHMKSLRVSDRVTEALFNVPRERFVPPERRDDAWLDVSLPIGHGQTISQPFVVALMTATLFDRPRARVLELGTGSGYILLSLLAQWPAARGTGTDLSQAAIRIAEANALLDDPARHAAMATAPNPFGDGQASRRILAEGGAPPVSSRPCSFASKGEVKDSRSRRASTSARIVVYACQR